MSGGYGFTVTGEPVGDEAVPHGAESSQNWNGASQVGSVVFGPANPSMPFIKADAGKDRWSLLPVDATREVVKVLGFGARKYDDYNWSRGANWSRYYDAAQRHMSAFWDRRDNDAETGLHHLAHAACCVLFLLAYSLRNIGTDDRP